MNNTIYKIRNLYCQYKRSETPVLHVESLDINKGSIVFIIGSSGVGKSTILETLGLMNNTINTIYNNKESIFEFNGSDSIYNLLEIWGKGDNELAKFRSKYLSFIFQSTNLFPTLSAYDNVNITQILQGKSQHEALVATKKIFTQIDLPVDMPLDKKITDLAGGQKQRIAFARAVSTDYTVLFGDEPTGNLDWKNASNVMNNIRQNVKSNGRTAIIVSHDINLAVEFADEIIYIEIKNINHPSYGFINNEGKYIKSYESKFSWKQNNSEFSDNEMIQLLREKFTKEKANENEQTF